MNEELRRKIKEAKSIHEKYIQMMDELMIKEKMNRKRKMSGESEFQGVRAIEGCVSSGSVC